MGKLELTKRNELMFDAATSGYGAEVSGGSSDERMDALLDRLEGRVTTVDCTEIESVDGFEEALLSAARGVEYSESVLHSAVREAGDAFNETGDNLVVCEFDSLPEEVQKPVAQRMKHFAERLENGDVGLAFTVASEGTVSIAEPDLSIRIRSFNLD